MDKKFFFIKFLLVCLLIILISLKFSNELFAYSTQAYSVDIPEQFIKGDEGVFYDEVGNAILFYYTESKINFYNEVYTEDDLNALIKYLSSDNINDEYLSINNVESIIKKDVINLSKNSYQAFHLVFEHKDNYATDEEYIHNYEQYYIFNNNVIYTIITQGEIPNSIFDSFIINMEYSLNMAPNDSLEKVEKDSKISIFSILNFVLKDIKAMIIISAFCIIIGFLGIRYFIKK